MSGEHCVKCGGATAGWKCAICGAENNVHDRGHVHGGSARYCTLLCRGCGEADVQCTCFRAG